MHGQKNIKISTNVFHIIITINSNYFPKQQ